MIRPESEPITSIKFEIQPHECASTGGELVEFPPFCSLSSGRQPRWLLVVHHDDRFKFRADGLGFAPLFTNKVLGIENDLYHFRD